MPLVSVVLSFRNEAAVLDELIARLTKALESAQVAHELIFVNDASTDASLDLLLINPGPAHEAYQGLQQHTTAIEPPIWAGLTQPSSVAEDTPCASSTRTPSDSRPHTSPKWSLPNQSAWSPSSPTAIIRRHPRRSCRPQERLRLPFVRDCRNK